MPLPAYPRFGPPAAGAGGLKRPRAHAARVIERFVRYEVRKEALDEAVRLAAALVDEVQRKEGGTASYKVWQEVAHPTRFLHHVVFRTPAAEQYHGKTAWRKRFDEALRPLCAQEPVAVDVRAVQPG